MSHIADTNKMSDTPRTDDESFFMFHSRSDFCKADLARQLERELNAANKRIKELEEAGDYIVEENDIYIIGKEEWRKAKESKP